MKRSSSILIPAMFVAGLAVLAVVRRERPATGAPPATTKAPTNLSPTTKGAAVISLDKLFVGVEGIQRKFPIPMYVPSEDTKEAASVLSIAPPITPGKLSSVAVSRARGGRWVVFLGGALSASPESALCLRLHVKNTDSKVAKFTIGNVVFKDTHGQSFSCVAASLNKSPLIAKPTANAIQVLKEIPIDVDPSKDAVLNLCFAIPPASLPVTLCFDAAESGYTVARHDDLLKEPGSDEDGGFAVGFGGHMDIDLPKGFGEISASTTANEPIAQFSVNPQLKPAPGKTGVTTAAQAGAVGSVSAYVIRDKERLNGVEEERSFPIAAIVNDIGCYFGGEVKFSKGIGPIELKSPPGPIDLRFESRFRAAVGDHIWAYATQDAVLSVRWASEDR